MKHQTALNCLWRSAPIAILLAVAAGGGLLINGLYRDYASLIEQARGQNVIPLFTAGRPDRCIAGTFLTYGILGTTPVLRFALSSPVVLIGFIVWGPVLGLAVIQPVFLFWRNSHTQRKNAPSIRSSVL